jgi:hypothetical protein
LTVTDIYVGSTTDFTRRKSEHKSKCNNPNAQGHNCKVYQTIRENGGWTNWSMILVENFPCENVNESHARERYWFEQMNANLNKYVPNRQGKEYHQDNRPNILEKMKQYNIDNKVKINAHKNTIILCNCGKFTTNRNKRRHENTFRHQKHLEIINCVI